MNKVNVDTIVMSKYQEQQLGQTGIIMFDKYYDLTSVSHIQSIIIEISINGDSYTNENMIQFGYSLCQLLKDNNVDKFFDTWNNKIDKNEMILEYNIYTCINDIKIYLNHYTGKLFRNELDDIVILNIVETIKK